MHSVTTTTLYTDYACIKRQFHKMVKHTQTIRREISDELFECVGSFCGIGA